MLEWILKELNRLSEDLMTEKGYDEWKWSPMFEQLLFSGVDINRLLPSTHTQELGPRVWLKFASVMIQLPQIMNLSSPRAGWSSSENSDLTDVRWTSVWVSICTEWVTVGLYMRGDDCQPMVDVKVFKIGILPRWRAMKHAEFSALVLGTTIPLTRAGMFAAIAVLEVNVPGFVAVTA
ncbi:hypothetical protein Tco_0434455 [Tanacetum coccineum]